MYQGTTPLHYQEMTYDQILLMVVDENVLKSRQTTVKATPQQLVSRGAIQRAGKNGKSYLAWLRELRRTDPAAAAREEARIRKAARKAERSRRRSRRRKGE